MGGCPFPLQNQECCISRESDCRDLEDEAANARAETQEGKRCKEICSEEAREGNRGGAEAQGTPIHESRRELYALQ